MRNIAKQEAMPVLTSTLGLWNSSQGCMGVSLAKNIKILNIIDLTEHY